MDVGRIDVSIPWFDYCGGRYPLHVLHVAMRLLWLNLHLHKILDVRQNDLRVLATRGQVFAMKTAAVFLFAEIKKITKRYS